MGGRTTMLAMVTAATMLAGCQSPKDGARQAAPPEKPAGHEASVPPTPSESPVSASSASSAPEPSDVPAVTSAGACRSTLIRRAGLADRDTDCADRVAALETVGSDAFACRTDADCRIVSLAGGCLGINAGHGARIDPLPKRCAGGTCATASFDDHRIRCEGGCCLIYEE